MFKKLMLNEGESPSPRLRVLAIVGVIVALIAVALTGIALIAVGPDTLLAQGDPDCPVTSLRTLPLDDTLRANGRWTTDDCDSRFRTNSDAKTYRFEVSEAGRIRINLTSAEADSYLYLMTEDGARITDNDDGGAGLDARIERTLDPGVYLVEATTIGGRDRGAANFTISVSYVEGCDIIHLGALQSGDDLTASGTWTIDTCGSRIAEAHPAYSYSFALHEAGTVRIDLVSEDGDPVLSLASSEGNVIGANDDGGSRRNARIEQYMQAGTYLIEATTYWVRDIQPRSADFDLTVHLVDEAEKQGTFLIKIETARVPDQVVAGEPFTVDYRVGNIGGGNLDEVDGNAWVYVIGPRVFERTDEIVASEDRWQAGISYHSSQEIASTTSVSIDELPSLQATFRSPGPTWLFVAVIVYDENDEQVGWHGRWHDLMVHDGFTFDSALVSVLRTEYRVSSEVDEEGEVTNSVRSITHPAHEIAADIRAKAVYTAGVAAHMLPDIFDRPTLSDLRISPPRQFVRLDNPSSSTALKMFATDLSADISALSLSEGFAAGESVNPVIVEDLLIGAASDASQRFSSAAAFWKAYQNWMDLGRALAFEEALDIHSRLNYAETVLAPTIRAGEIVQAARDSESGWDDPDVQSMVDEFAADASCGDTRPALRNALRLAGSEDVDAFLDLDAEMRNTLPIYALATDAVLCATGSIDSQNSRFLTNLSIAGNEAIEDLFTTESPDPEVVTSYQLRIIARLGEDGRIEHGVETSAGERVLPDFRHLPADPVVNQWLLSSDVEIGDSSIGQIRTRRLTDGRVELRFQTVNGQVITPDIRFLASNIPTGVWLRTSEIEVPLFAEITGQLE